MMDNNKPTNLQYFAGVALSERQKEKHELENDFYDIPEQKVENKEAENPSKEYTDKKMIYPKMEITDNADNEIRDARNFIFNSNLIAAANKSIPVSGLYNHYES